MSARRFILRREQDITGVSGVGVVAEGIEFTGGTVALRWLGLWPTSVVFHDRGIAAVEAVHGHGGSTIVVWLDPDGRDPNDLARECATLQDDLAAARADVAEARDRHEWMTDERDRLADLLTKHGHDPKDGW